jgi:hypothetical protein
MNSAKTSGEVNEGDGIDRILSEFELVGYIAFLIEYIEAAIDGYAIREDARFCLDEAFFPDHPVMLQVRDLLVSHGRR